MNYKCSEDMYNICENNSKCYLCDGERLYQEPSWMIKKKKEQRRKSEGTPKKKKEGIGFEKRVVKAYNDKINPNMGRDIACRRPGSGSIWNMPGDIVTEEELFECKERGSVTARGEKTITIPKEHFDKVKQEAALAKKDIWYYVFAYKNSDNIFLVKDFQDELKMIQQIQILKNKIIELESDISID